MAALVPTTLHCICSKNLRQYVPNTHHTSMHVARTSGSSRQATGGRARERLANIPPDEATTKVMMQEAIGCLHANWSPPVSMSTQK